MAEAIPVDAADPSKKTSEIIGPNSDEATVQMSELDEHCYWNGTKYPQGDKIATGRQKYECSFGRWIVSED